MNQIKVAILSAFIHHNKGGNPAGVVLDADHLTSSEKLKIACKVGLSETAFVSKSTIADFKLEFFTPNRQIAHCGHATIATFSFLKQLKKIDQAVSSKETVDGVRKIILDQDLAFMEQTAPTYMDVDDYLESILKSLNIEEADLLDNAPIRLVNTGNSFLLIPVRSTEVLKNIKPDHELIKQISDAFDLIGFYPFSIGKQDDPYDAYARMFGPRYGIDEEAGTGMAAGPLACYFFDHLKIKRERYRFIQGKHMTPSSPSLILVDLLLEQGKISGLMAGGKGKQSSSMTITLG